MDEKLKRRWFASYLPIVIVIATVGILIVRDLRRDLTLQEAVQMLNDQGSENIFFEFPGADGTPARYELRHDR